MQGGNNVKYFGILKSFDFDAINRNTFPRLIESNIFDISEASYYNSEDASVHYDGMDVDDQMWGICDTFIYNRKYYNIKHEVWNEMFQRCRGKLENFDDLQIKIEELELDLHFQVSLASKIRILKEYMMALNQSMSDSTYYLLYLKDRETEGCESWYEFFHLGQVNEIDFNYLFKFLKGDNNFVPIFISQIWSEYFLTKMLNKYCKDKILKFELISGIREDEIIIAAPSGDKILPTQITDEKRNDNHQNDIFCDDGEDLFKYIVSRYSDTRNKAFYSYLYYYLRDINKIDLLSDDNRKYKDYVIANSTIQSISKIQNTAKVEHSPQRNRVLALFDRYTTDFEDAKKNRRKIE